MRNKIILITLLSFLGLVLFSFASAQVRDLEVDYPAISDFEIESTTVSFPQYVKYVYYFLLGISGLVGLGVMIWAGFRYMTSAGSPQKMQEAREWITSTLIGLLVLFLSWIIINTINPEFTMMVTKPALPFVSDIPRGVVLCEEETPQIYEAWFILGEYSELEITNETTDKRKELKKEFEEKLSEIADRCVRVQGDGSGTNSDAEYAYFIPTERYTYGAIFWEENNREGRAQVFTPVALVEGGRLYDQKIGLSKIGSAKVFRVNPDPDPNWKVTLYSHENFNRDRVEEVFEKTYPREEIGWTDWQIPYFDIHEDLGGKSPKSIDIKADGHVIVLLSIGGVKRHRAGVYAIFTSKDSNLLDEEEITSIGRLDRRPYPEATAMKLISIY